MGLFGGADLPDLPNIDAQLNLMTSLMEQLGREVEERRRRIGPLEDQFIQSINDLVSRYAPEAAKAFDFSNELRGLYRTTALPAERRLFSDLQKYDTPQRRAFEFSRAAGGVVNAARAQQGAITADLRRSGVDPNDPRYAARRQQEANEVGALAAAAGRQAQEGVEDRGIARRLQAAQIGRGWNTLADTALGQGTQLAGAIPAALGTGYQMLAATGGTPLDFQSAQLAAANNYIDTMMQRYNAKLGRSAARQGAAMGLGRTLGSLAGAGAGFALGGGFGGGLNALRGAFLGSRLFGGGSGDF